MKTKRLLISLVLGLGLIPGLLWSLGGQIAPAEAMPPAGPALWFDGLTNRYVEGPVPKPGSPPPTETHVCPTCSYTSIQEAVDDVASGGLIKVAEGTYSDVHARSAPEGYEGSPSVGQVVYVDKDVTIRGGYTSKFDGPPDPMAHPTVIDAQGQGRGVFVVGATVSSTPQRQRAAEASGPVLEGLQITGGDATGFGGGPYPYDGTGGGVYVGNASVTISKCAIYGNVAGRNDWSGGGGVYLFQASGSELIDNVIYSNTASTTSISGLSGEGGGVAIAGSNALLEGNSIYDNVASTTGFALGGGVYMEGGSPIFRNNVIRDNTASLTGAGQGGGIFNGYYGDPLLVNTVLIGNVCGASPNSIGAGIASEFAGGRFVHTTLQHNTGGDGSGVHAYTYSDLTFTNVILANQTVGVYASSDSAIAVDGVLWHNNGANTGGPGTISVSHYRSGNPAFTPDGYHLRPGSAAIDRGLPADVDDDVDGAVRPHGLAPDLGADEWNGQQTIEPELGGTLVYTDPQGLPLTIEIPPGAVVETATLDFTPRLTPTHAFSPGVNFVGHAFDLDALWEAAPAVISATKRADPVQLTEPGGAVAFTLVITNNSNFYSVTLSSLVDDPYGDVTDAANPNLAGTDCETVTIPARYCYRCTFTATVAGDAGQWLTDTVVISGTDGGGNSFSAEDSAVVAVTDVTSTIAVTKTAAPAEVVTPGGPVTFTVEIENLSAVDEVTITGLEDDPYGDVTDAGNPNLLGTTCQTVTISASDGYQCAFAALVGGGGGDRVTDTVTVSGVDDDGVPVGGSADALVSIAHARIYLPLVMRHHAGGSVALGPHAALVHRPLSALEPPGQQGGGCAVGAEAPYSCLPTFRKPITVTLHYSDEDVEGIDEENLRLYYWTGSAWEDAANSCSPPSQYHIMPLDNVLQVPICHLSEFAYGG